MDVDFDAIESQNRVCRSFNIRHDDDLKFRAVSEDSKISGTVGYYMTHVRGADKTIILKPDNSFVVLDSGQSNGEIRATNERIMRYVFGQRPTMSGG